MGDMDNRRAACRFKDSCIPKELPMRKTMWLAPWAALSAS